MELNRDCFLLQCFESGSICLHRAAARLPKFSAEKRTREQPTGKEISFKPWEMRSGVAGGSVEVQYVRTMITLPKRIPAMSPTAAWATAPPQGRCATQPRAAPRHPYSIPLMRARRYTGVLLPAIPPTARIWTAPCWRKRETLKARGAARSPSNPITGSRTFEAAGPRASPAQTMVDQETLPTRSATVDSKPGRIPKPPASSRSRISMAIPRRIASHATCRRVAPKLEPPAVELVGVAPLLCPDSFINQSPLSSLLLVRQGGAL